MQTSARHSTTTIPSPQKSGLLGRLPIWANSLQPPTEFIFIATALVVGISTGIGAVAFRYLIQGVEWVGYRWLPGLIADWGKLYVIIVPALGGLIVGPLIYFFAREAKGHGVPEVMEAVALRGGRIRPVVALIKSLASSISIGSGGSVGREGPIVQIGSAIGSSVGQVFHLSEERIRNLVACGAAAGIAATFNAPIAGVIFALEVILGEFSVRYFSTVVISAVAASVIGQVAFGDVPAFAIPVEYGINSLWEFAFYPLLGLAAAFVGVIFVRLLYWAEDLFAAWKRVPEWVQPAFGGVFLGSLALGYPLLTGVTWDTVPQIFNVGYGVIESALASQLTLSVVLVLLVLKLIATSITLGSGGSGGVFAPSLFMGAMLGVAFELIVNAIFPGIPSPSGAYALVGMAAVFSASAHAPITAVIILFELTGDYRIIMPLMLTVVVATLISNALLRGESIYTLKLSRRGVRLQRGRDVDVMQAVIVADVMASEDVVTVNKEMMLDGLSETIARTLHHGFPILDQEGKLWGMVTVSDLNRALARNVPRSSTVAQIGVPRDRLQVAYPDETMGDALARMSWRGLGRLPVVSRDEPTHFLGLIRRADIVRAYRLGLARKANIQHRAERIKLRNVDGTEFVELILTQGDSAVGKELRALSERLPKECILISVRRDGRMFIPHGDTVFEVGDRLTVFVLSEQIDGLYACLRG